MGKAKAVRTSRAKEGIHSLISHWQAGVQPSRRKQGSIMCNRLLGKTNAITPNIPPPFFFPQFYMLSMTSYGIEHSLWPVWVNCLSCVPSQLPMHLTAQANMRSWKVL